MSERDGRQHKPGPSPEPAKSTEQADFVPHAHGQDRSWPLTDPMRHVRYERQQAAMQIQRSLKVWRKEKSRGSSVSNQIPQGGGSPLTNETRHRMEQQLGADLSGAKIHTGADSAKAAAQMGARAFTVGNDVHFGSSEFAPGTKEGDRLLAHELTHVVQSHRSGVQRKAEEVDTVAAHAQPGTGPLDAGKAEDAHDSDGAHEHGPPEVSQPGDPAEKEADTVADHAADQLHGGSATQGHGPQTNQKAPKIGAKSAGPRIFRAAGDPKSVAELAAKLSGKALEAYQQMKELEQERTIDGICASAKVKQSDGTLNVVGAQSAFEARWLDPTQFASKKLLKDQAFKKKIDDALAAIKNSCDETDGTNRPGASLGDGTSETALSWEAEHGKPWKSKEGHYQKVPNYIGTIEAAVAELQSMQSKIKDATVLDQVTKAIDRGTKRVAKMKPSVDTWKNRVSLHPTVWKSDGDSKVQPGFPAIK
jgi:hypothetical protein